MAEESNLISEEFCHIRVIEIKVREDLNVAIYNLKGKGISVSKAYDVVIVVGNVIFGRKWQRPRGDDNTFNANTLPENVIIRTALQMIETLYCL